MGGDGLYREILDSVSEAVVCLEPLYGVDNQIEDFRILYENPVFKTYFGADIEIGGCSTEFNDKLACGINWNDNAIQTAVSNKRWEFDFFSPALYTWFHLIQRRVGKDLVMCTMTNITEKKMQSRSLDFLGSVDMLTGLNNRTSFYETLDAAIPTAQRLEIGFGIAFIDIDDMRLINELSGHYAGDQMIKRAAHVLNSFENHTQHMFRFGDDQFAVFKNDLGSADEMTAFCRNILYALAGNGIKVSVGVALYPQHETHAAALMKFADLAMHAAKGRNMCKLAVFEPAMYDNFNNHVLMQQNLYQALRDHLFELYYQPQFDIATNKLRGFEALIRWYDKMSDRWINPEDFIHAAEESDAIIDIGSWVLDEAVSKLKKWQVAYHFKGTMSVNVSPVQMKHDDFVDTVFKVLEKYDVNPESLELEITEGRLIGDMTKAKVQLKQLRAAGIHIALDDFGIGYSSLKYLNDLPLTCIKFDKTFIERLQAQDDLGMNIVSSIIVLSGQKGVDTIAEGVEHNEQLSVLKNLHCDYVQGFLSGKPMPDSRCELFLSGKRNALDKLTDEEETA